MQVPPHTQLICSLPSPDILPARPLPSSPPPLSQALLAQMLAQGYGCKQDPEEARRWAERARARGYSMSGVYCEL
jgi:hypothetical protein